MAQENAIAAGDHGEGILDKVHGRVAQRRGLPGIGRNAGHAVNDARDLAVGRAVHAPVDRLQHVAGTPALLLGEAGIGRDSTAKQGFEQTLEAKKSRAAPANKLLDGEQEVKVIATRLGPPPRGYSNWTLRLLARKVVELEIVESISHEMVRQTLKKTV